MQNVVAQRRQIRQDLMRLYGRRGLNLSVDAGRIRLYGDAFVDALVKRSYFDTSLSVGKLFWLPQCIACCDLGQLSMPADPRQRSVNGNSLLNRVERKWGTRPFSGTLREIVAGFHERWDGLGFPNRLSGRQIPLAVRIAVIVHDYSQSTPSWQADRPKFYNSALEKVYDDHGRRYDPELVEIFLGAVQELRLIDGYIVEQSNSVACG